MGLAVPFGQFLLHVVFCIFCTEEFTKAIPLLQSWGVNIEVSDAKAVFDTIDTNHGGVVLFEEFCDWSLTTAMDYDKSLDSGNSQAVQIDRTNTKKREKHIEEKKSKFRTTVKTNTIFFLSQY